mmetsp:Transcript_89602/g.255941  ORF Transcript_89602/g.255941 Transcript_89602/m.255941 type:complete len:216 (-) Transcript_89602:1392-2039(-)
MARARCPARNPLEKPATPGALIEPSKLKGPLPYSAAAAVRTTAALFHGLTATPEALQPAPCTTPAPSKCTAPIYFSSASSPAPSDCLDSSSSASLIIARKSASTFRSSSSIFSSLPSFLSADSRLRASASAALARLRSRSRTSRFFSCLVSRSNMFEIAVFSLACGAARLSHTSSRLTVPFTSPTLTRRPAWLLTAIHESSWSPTLCEYATSFCL